MHPSAIDFLGTELREGTVFTIWGWEVTENIVVIFCIESQSSARVNIEKAKKRGRQKINR